MSRTGSPTRPLAVECVDGPYRGFVATLRPGQTRVRVRDRETDMECAWYTLDAGDTGGVRLKWDPESAN